MKNLVIVLLFFPVTALAIDAEIEKQIKKDLEHYNFAALCSVRPNANAAGTNFSTWYKYVPIKVYWGNHAKAEPWMYATKRYHEIRKRPDSYWYFSARGINTKNKPLARFISKSDKGLSVRLFGVNRDIMLTGKQFVAILENLAKDKARRGEK